VNKETKSGQILDVPTLKRLYSFVGPYKKQFYGLILIIMFSAILSPALPLLIKYTIDVPVAEQDYAQLTQMVLLMLSLIHI
jgi:ATP-binding cassette subfamily B protein